MTPGASPLRRIVGAAASWLLFCFFLTGLLLLAGTVIAMGGSCASGGPFVSARPCPGSALLFVPFGVLGMFVAVGLSVALARDFAAPLYAWAWPALFTGLGVVFLLGALAGFGIVSNLVVAALAFAMGLGPAVPALRGGGWRTLLVGSRSVRGELFEGPEPRSRMLRPRPAGEAAPVPLGAVHVLVAVGIPLVAAVTGVWLATVVVEVLD